MPQAKVFRIITFRVLTGLLCMDCKIGKKAQYDLEDKNESSSNEGTWVQAAKVWDRLFFWICLLTLVAIWIYIFSVALKDQGPKDLILIDSTIINDT